MSFNLCRIIIPVTDIAKAARFCACGPFGDPVSVVTAGREFKG
jgi:hypothetical protein